MKQAQYSLDKIKEIAGSLIELTGQELFEAMSGCVSDLKKFNMSGQRKSFYKYCTILIQHKGDLYDADGLDEHFKHFIVLMRCKDPSLCAMQLKAALVKVCPGFEDDDSAVVDIEDGAHHFIWLLTGTIGVSIVQLAKIVSIESIEFVRILFQINLSNRF